MNHGKETCYFVFNHKPCTLMFSVIRQLMMFWFWFVKPVKVLSAFFHSDSCDDDDDASLVFTLLVMKLGFLFSFCCPQIATLMSHESRMNLEKHYIIHSFYRIDIVFGAFCILYGLYLILLKYYLEI